MRKVLSLFIALCLVLSLCTGIISPVPNARAATLQVGPGQTYTTIQAAIDAAAAGDTINVAAGTYAEHVTIGKRLSLLGADKTTTIIDGSGIGVVVTITAGEVVLKNFTVQHSGIDIATCGGIVLVSVTGCTIENNNVTANASGIGLLASSSNFVTNNTISTSARYGIVMDGYPVAPANPSLGNTLHGNVIASSGRDGIYIGQDCDGNALTENYVSGTTGMIEVEHGFEGNGIYFWKSSHNTLTGNHLFNNTLGSGLEMMGSHNNTITGNYVTGNKNGLVARRSASYANYPNTFSGNTISGNTDYGVFTDYAVAEGAFDATGNWWGTAVRASIGASISGSVDFDPWYVDAAKTTLSNGAPISVYVGKGYVDGAADGHAFGYDAFATIQEGIAAVAASGTVHVAAGTYAEDVTIGKQLTLVGAGASTTTINGSGLGVVVTVGASNVTVSGFTVQNSGSNPLAHAGIGLVGVTGCTIGPNTITNSIHGVALMSGGSNIVSGNTITGSGCYGIYIGTDLSPSLGNTVNANNITGSGRDGIYVDKDCNGQHITDNTISGTVGNITYGGAEGNGIYFWKSSNNTVTGNTISSNIMSGNQVGYGIEMYGSSGNTITGNTIMGNLDGMHIRNIDAVTGYSILNNTINHNKIYGNTRVNLYASPNFWFDVTGNWWGSADGEVIRSKIASWDASGNVVPGTTVFISYWPWYVDVAMTTLSMPGSVGTSFDHSAYTCRAGQSLSITSTTTYGDMSGADPAARVDALVTLSHAFTSDVIIHANAGATPLGINYTLPAGQTSFWISSLVPIAYQRPLLTAESFATESFTLIIDSVPEGAAGTTTVTAQVVATPGSFVTPPVSTDVLSTASATLDVAVAALSLVPSAGTTKWANGDTFDLTVHFDVTGVDVNALDAKITYDMDHLEVTGIDWLPTANPFDQEVEKNYATPGVILLAAGDLSGLTGPFAVSGDVAVIHFRTKTATTGTTPVDFDLANTRVMKPNTNDIDHPTNVLTAAAGATITVNDIQVTATGDHATYAPNPDIVEYNGTASFTVTPAAGYYLVSVDSGVFTYDGTTSTYTWTIPNVTASITVTAALGLLNDVYVAKTGSDTLNDGHDPLFPVLTIGRGIAVVAASGTVHVAAGTYAEHVTISKSLHLIGAGAPTTIIDGSSSGTVVTVTENSVTMSGFGVQNSGRTALDAGILLGTVTGVGTGTGVTSCTITGNTLTTSVNGIAMLFGSSNAITTNTLEHNGAWSILLVASTGNHVESNAVAHNDYEGIVLDNQSALGGSVYDQGSTGNFIQANTVTDMVYDEAIFIGQNCNANSITGNVIDGAHVGIHIWRSNGQTVTLNTIRNCGGTYYHGDGYSAVGIRLRNAQNNTITGNTVTLNMKGFEIVANEAPYCTGNQIHNNNISGNGSAMDVVNGGNVVDAINNWWGAESGPLDSKILPGTPSYNNLSGLGNSVGSFVDYKPFWMNDTMTIDSTITVTVSIANGTHNATVPVTVQFGNNLTLTATPDTYYYVYSTTDSHSTTTPLLFTNRMLGLPQVLTFDNITGTLPDRTATITINVFRRGDIAGNSGPDTRVNITDLGVLITQWRKTTTDIPELLADLNCDLSVNISDLSMMMSLWQTTP